MAKQNKKPIIRLESIVKSFPGVRALDGVTLELFPGSVHALMGENGAGKSTLMKCLFGVYKRDGGRILLDGEEIEFSGTRDALQNGVAMVHQELSQAENLTVMDNMWLGRFPKVAKLLPIVSEKKMYEKTKEILCELEIDTDPKRKVNTLSVSKRQMIEIAKAVSYGARVIVFDEPTSSLTEPEAEHLFRIIEKLKNAGCAIVYISHKMEEILRICDTVTVMRDGKLIETRPAADITTDEIIRLMVGRKLTERYPKREGTPCDVILKVENLSGAHTHLKDVSFDLRKGEILGIGGLDGAGRSELLETIFAIRKQASGKIYLQGKEISLSSPADAKSHGFALLTEERRRNGIFSILSVRENLIISSLKKYLCGPLLSEKKINAVSRYCIKNIRIKAPSDRVKISTLSGGNQQKVILGRWLLTEPSILMLDEPTRGIDVGAKYEIYKLICELAENGKGIIVVSSEMPELIGICDRIIVMSGGRIAGELKKGEFSQEGIMSLASKFA